MKNSHKTQTHKSPRFDLEFTKKELLKVNQDCLRLSHQYSVSFYAMLTFDFSLHIMNEALCNILGCNDNVLLQTDFRELIIPDDRNRFRNLLSGLNSQSETSAFCEKLCLYLKGKYIWVNVTAILMHSNQDQPSFYVLLMDVVSTRKQTTDESDHLKQKLLSFSEFAIGNDNPEIKRPAEEPTGLINKENRLSNDMLAFVFDQSNEMVFILDENTKIVFANKKACEFLGYNKSELLTICIEDIAPHFKEEVEMQSSVADHQSDGTSIIEMFFKTKDRGSYLVEVKISLFQSTEWYFLYMANDISGSIQE
jgi:PAS domain S-box-containing protein